jgi:molybdopterin-containing oxidoreductase family membrane subunit
MRVTILINLLMVGSELFVEFYTGGSHTSAAHYLYFGHEGKTALVPWIWSSLAMTTGAAVLLLWPGVQQHHWRLNFACVIAFIGIWIEKGMGLIIPGFIPSTLHEIVEYLPSNAEWKITAGIWAFGLLIYTVLLKIMASVMMKKITPEKYEI